MENGASFITAGEERIVTLIFGRRETEFVGNRKRTELEILYARLKSSYGRYANEQGPQFRSG